jgi:hypothetical protein
MLLRPIGLALCCAVACCLAGCSGGADVQSLAKDVDTLKVAVRSLQVMEPYRPVTITYQLVDVGRKGKVVGYIESDVHITKGERVFLGDDIWDVVYVKIFTTPDQTSGNGQRHRVSQIQLLVSFGGKGRDPDK